MSDEITKSELQLMIDVQSKSAQQMERVAIALNSIAEENKKISDAITNDLAKKIIDGVQSGCVQCKLENLSTGKIVKKIEVDVTHTKWIVGAVSLIVAIVLVVMHLIKH